MAFSESSSAHGQYVCVRNQQAIALDARMKDKCPMYLRGSRLRLVSYHTCREGHCLTVEISMKLRYWGLEIETRRIHYICDALTNCLVMLARCKHH